jgi:hypothetical protein
MASFPLRVRPQPPRAGGGDLAVVVRTVEAVEQLLLLVGEPLETFQQDHRDRHSQVDPPAPRAFGLAPFRQP